MNGVYRFHDNMHLEILLIINNANNTFLDCFKHNKNKNDDNNNNKTNYYNNNKAIKILIELSCRHDFHSGKTKEDYKLQLRARCQRPNEAFELIKESVSVL